MSISISVFSGVAPVQLIHGRNQPADIAPLSRGIIDIFPRNRRTLHNLSSLCSYSISLSLQGGTNYIYMLFSFFFPSFFTSSRIITGKGPRQTLLLLLLRGHGMRREEYRRVKGKEPTRPDRGKGPPSSVMPHVRLCFLIPRPLHFSPEDTA